MKSRAERLMGEMLKETVRKKGERDEMYHRGTFEPKLEDIGISRNQSSRYQKAASAPISPHSGSMDAIIRRSGRISARWRAFHFPKPIWGGFLRKPRTGPHIASEGI